MHPVRPEEDNVPVKRYQSWYVLASARSDTDHRQVWAPQHSRFTMSAIVSSKWSTCAVYQGLPKGCRTQADNRARYVPDLTRAQIGGGNLTHLVRHHLRCMHAAVLKRMSLDPSPAR